MDWGYKKLTNTKYQLLIVAKGKGSKTGYFL